jgi:hypothetical protein
MDKSKGVEPHVLQSYYYSVFAGEQGRVVLNDIKLLLTGVGLNGYEGVDPLLPHNELASRTATRNAWDMIDGMTQDVVAEKKSFLWLIKETIRIYKHSRKGK